MCGHGLVHHVGNLFNVGHQLFIVSTCDEDGLVDVGHISDRDRFNLVRAQAVASVFPGRRTRSAVAHHACAVVFDVLQKLGDGDPVHIVENDASKSAPLSGTSCGHDELSFCFDLKPRLVMQPANHVADVCRDFELVLQTTAGSDDGCKVRCGSHVHAASHESVINRVGVSACFTDSETT